MIDEAARDLRRERRRGRTGEAGSESSRHPNYRSLKNPFLPQPIFSDDQVAAIHAAALRVLEELGIKVLLPEARAIYAKAGALVDEDSQMVRIGRDMVEEALSSAPRSIPALGGDRSRDLTLELGSMAFLAGSGAPNVTDLERDAGPERSRLLRNSSSWSSISTCCTCSGPASSRRTSTAACATMLSTGRS